MRLTLAALLLAFPAFGQSDTSREIDRKLTALEAAQSPGVVGPQSVSVAVGASTSFRLDSPLAFSKARYVCPVGTRLFTAEQVSDGWGVDVTVTGRTAGVGYIVFTFAGDDLNVQVTVGSGTPEDSNKPKAVPAMARPKASPTPPDPKPLPPDPKPLPPDPPPPPPPDPPPPDPVKAKLWGVVIVEETGDAVSTRGAFLADKALADYRAAHGQKFRVVDRDVVGADGKPPADVVRFLDKAKAAKLPMIFLVGTDGKEVYSGPVPATAAELVDLLKAKGE